MSSYYNLDGIRTAFNKEVEEEKAKLELWEKVEFVTKKDGTPFKVLSKNIKNATLVVEAYMQFGENKLRVIGWFKDLGYVTDELPCYDLVEDLNNPTYKCYDPEKVAKTQNYLPKQPYLKQIYQYDLDDIKKALAKRIETKKQYIATLESQKDLVDIAFNNFKKAYGYALKQLELDTKKEESSHLYYMILDTVKDRFPYC